MTTDHCANPGSCWVHGLTDEVIAEEIRASHQQLTNGGNDD